MPRKNPFVKVGRPSGQAFGASRAKRGVAGPTAAGPPPGGPLGAAAPGAGPMGGFSPAVPAAAFRRGGSTNGFKCMPQHHDDPKLCRGGKA